MYISLLVSPENLVLYIHVSRPHSLVDTCNILHSRFLSAGHCIKNVRRIYMPITPGSKRVNMYFFFEVKLGTFEYLGMHIHPVQ